MKQLWSSFRMVPKRHYVRLVVEADPSVELQIKNEIVKSLLGPPDDLPVEDDRL